MAPTFGTFGERFADAEKTDFFSWFHLTEIERTAAGAAKIIVTFKPSGPAFHTLVTFEVTVDKGDRLRAMELVLARSFINDARNGAFAGDIAKSFLLDAVAPEDRAEINDLANEMQFPRHLSSPILMRGSPPELPATPTPGYATFLGERESYEQRFSRTILTMKNATTDAGEALHMRLEAKDAKRAPIRQMLRHVFRRARRSP
jgi:hypothetical protein